MVHRNKKMVSIRYKFACILFLAALLVLSLYYLDQPPPLVGLEECRGDRINCRPRIRNRNSQDFIDQYITLNVRASGKRWSFFREPHSPHVTVRNKTLVAVVTTEKYLLTRARAIYETWARDVRPHSKLYFFVGEDCDISSPELAGFPIIKMPGVRDNIYPPQGKVFAVLEYMFLRFGEDFKWFLRADDDVYIRMDKLDGLLDQLEWTEQLYLGQPGKGKPKDIKRLKLLPHENYCMGGPGVIFSATALVSLYPYLGKCLEAVQWYNKGKGHALGWYNEDVELGRCVSRTVGIDCSTMFKEDLFFQDYTSDPNHLWDESQLRSFTTIHPVKNQDNLRAIHYFYKSIEYKILSKEMEDKSLNLKSLCQRTPRTILLSDSADVIHNCSRI